MVCDYGICKALYRIPSLAITLEINEDSAFYCNVDLKLKLFFIQDYADSCQVGSYKFSYKRT